MRFRMPPTKPSIGMQTTMAATMERIVAVRIDPMRGASAGFTCCLKMSRDLMKSQYP